MKRKKRKGQKRLPVNQAIQKGKGSFAGKKSANLDSSAFGNRTSAAKLHDVEGDGGDMKFTESKLSKEEAIEVKCFSERIGSVALKKDEEFCEPFSAKADEAKEEACERFLSEIYAQPESKDELPIRSEAAEETVIPVMESFLESFKKSKGRLLETDAEFLGPVMVVRSLESLVPLCSWNFDQASGEFVFGKGTKVKSEKGRSVIESLIFLSGHVVDKFLNQESKLKEQGDGGSLNFSETGAA